MTECPFCGRDPFHYTDSGEAVAVTCCDLGDLYFRGARSAPEEVTLSWEEFTDIGFKLMNLRNADRAHPESIAGCLHPGNEPNSCQYEGQCLSASCNHNGKTWYGPRMTLEAQTPGILYPKETT